MKKQTKTQRAVILLHDAKTNEPILIGTESIINAVRKSATLYDSDSRAYFLEFTQIESRGAMISTARVSETVEEIYSLIND